jgi:ADP-heptose:LPS heptosyltransferase
VIDTRVHDVASVAVVRASGLGDLVFALPALGALRDAYPSARITLLANARHQELLAGRPSPADEVEVIPAYGGVSLGEHGTQSGPEIDAFFARMRARQFDIALQLHGGGGNSNPFVQRLGARVTAGSCAPGAPPLDRWIRYETYYPEVLRCVEVVRLVGAGAPADLAPRLSIVDDDYERAQVVLQCHDRPIAVLHPGATDPRRRWPAARFAAVGSVLAEWGFDVVVTGSDTEDEVATGVADQMIGRARVLAGLTSLSGLLGVLACASVVVANDTGPLHLAAAVGTPTVGIYWVGNALNYGMHAMSANRRCISWQVDCPECGAHCMHESCGHNASFVTDVSVADVLGATRDVLDVSGRLSAVATNAFAIGPHT